MAGGIVQCIVWQQGRLGRCVDSWGQRLRSFHADDAGAPLSRKSGGRAAAHSMSSTSEACKRRRRWSFTRPSRTVARYSAGGAAGKSSGVLSALGAHQSRYEAQGAGSGHPDGEFRAGCLATARERQQAMAAFRTARDGPTGSGVPQGRMLTPPARAAKPDDIDPAEPKAGTWDVMTADFRHSSATSPGRPRPANGFARSGFGPIDGRRLAKRAMPAVSRSI